MRFGAQLSAASVDGSDLKKKDEDTMKAKTAKPAAKKAAAKPAAKKAAAKKKK